MSLVNRFRLSLTLCGLVCATFFAILAPTVNAAALADFTAATCPQIPEGVNPLTLSTGQLAYYGLPSQMPGESHAQWTKILTHAHHRSCTMTPDPNMHAWPAHSANAPTSIWGGYAGLKQQGQNINFASMEWNVPGIPNTGQDGDSATWVGIGGLDSSNLVQTGTEQEVSYFLWWPTYTYRAWIENYGDASNSGANYVFNVNNTDSMLASVHNNQMFIIDYTSGSYANQAYGPNPDFDTADYIVERVGNADLADFQSVTMHNDYYYSDALPRTTFTLVQNHSFSFVIRDGANVPQVAVGGITNASFTVSWLQGG